TSSSATRTDGCSSSAFPPVDLPASIFPYPSGGSVQRNVTARRPGRGASVAADYERPEARGWPPRGVPPKRSCTTRASNQTQLSSRYVSDGIRSASTTYGVRPCEGTNGSRNLKAEGKSANARNETAT